MSKIRMIRNNMRKYLLTLLVAATIFGCSSTSNELPTSMLGEWNAKWETFAESYPDVTDVKSFTMDGKWTFDEQGAITVAAYGFEGCIFGEDTIIHTQKWKVTNDTLSLINDDQIHGMTYKIVSQEEDKIKLQLMKDIFVHLEK